MDTKSSNSFILPIERIFPSANLNSQIVLFANNVPHKYLSGKLIQRMVCERQAVKAYFMEYDLILRRACTELKLPAISQSILDNIDWQKKFLIGFERAYSERSLMQLPAGLPQSVRDWHLRALSNEFTRLHNMREGTETLERLAKGEPLPKPTKEQLRSLPTEIEDLVNHRFRNELRLLREERQRLVAKYK